MFLCLPDLVPLAVQCLAPRMLVTRADNGLCGETSGVSPSPVEEVNGKGFPARLGEHRYSDIKAVPYPNPQADLESEGYPDGMSSLYDLG